MIAPAPINTEPDEMGNYYTVQQVVRNNERKVWFFLAAEGQTRVLGSVFPIERIFKTTRSRNKHLFLKNSSYGFNDNFLRTALMFDFVVLTDEFGVYKIPRTVILEEGTFLHFKQVGFERQIFLPLKRIEEFITDRII
jgi:hypothetical protein